MQTKVKKIIITFIVLCAIGIPVGRHWYNHNAVKFKDITMEKVIANACGKSYSEGVKITPEDMKKIKKLDIGYVGYYNTLEDLKWCTNIETLNINGKPGECDYTYKLFQGKKPEKLEKKKIHQFEEELGEILPKLKKMKSFRMVSGYGCEWNSLNFLKKCTQIKELWIYKFEISDYSTVKECKSLEKIIIFNSSIKNAEDIIGIEHLKWIGLVNTPLSENSEEIKKLQEVYPNAKIEY